MSVILDLTIIGLAVALYPVALTVFILILASRRGSRKGAAFVVGWIVSLAVVPDYRGRGFAKGLLRALEKHARENGASKLALEVGVVNVPALNLYLHDGFRLVGTVADYYGKGKDAFYLEKRL